MEGFTTAEPAEGVIARAGGQGLGLALVRQLARRRGGDVRVLDPGSSGGPGAVFMATMPGVTGKPGDASLAESSAAAEPPAAERKEGNQ
ncbi:histidine kinase [Arthrobacter sp. Hiyo8]|nr:histidine kinase [Arthrobacter sp. Hiyo8]